MSSLPYDVDALLSAAEQAIPDSRGARWWVAHTRARNEKALARDLTRLEVVNFLPLRRKASRSPRTGRCSISTVPVFDGYLFFKATEQQRYQVMATNRVANTLFVRNQRQLVTQLRHIHRVLMTDTAFEHFNGVRVGRWVRVGAGPLAGVEGKVVRKLGRTRLAIAVDMLGQSVVADVDAELLERIDAPESASGQRPPVGCAVPLAGHWDGRKSEGLP